MSMIVRLKVVRHAKFGRRTTNSVWLKVMRIVLEWMRKFAYTTLAITKMISPYFSVQNLCEEMSILTIEGSRDFSITLDCTRKHFSNGAIIRLNRIARFGSTDANGEPSRKLRPEMETSKIEMSLIRKLHSTYIEVVAEDVLPETSLRTIAIVVYSDPASKPGTH